MLIPIKLTPSFFPAYSSFEFKTSSGFVSLLSDNPISSNKISDIGNSSFLIFLFLAKNWYFPSAIWNNFSTSSGLVDSEPWKNVWIICGYFLKNFSFEYFPLIDLFINWALNDFPVPGLPIIIKGIFVTTAINNKNTISSKDLFLPIPLSNSILSNKNFSSIFNISLKWFTSSCIKSSFSNL